MKTRGLSPSIQYAFLDMPVPMTHMLCNTKRKFRHLRADVVNKDTRVQGM